MPKSANSVLIVDVDDIKTDIDYRIPEANITYVDGGLILSGYEGLACVRIYNVLGQVVKSINGVNNYQWISLSNLEKGGYFVHLLTDESSIVNKIIVN